LNLCRASGDDREESHKDLPGGVGVYYEEEVVAGWVVPYGTD